MANTDFELEIEDGGHREVVKSRPCAHCSKDREEDVVVVNGEGEQESSEWSRVIGNPGPTLGSLAD